MDPMPGPSLMLPALDLSGTPEFGSSYNFTKKKRKLNWKRLVSSLHREWCLCGSFINHFILPPNSLVCTEDGDDRVAGDTAEDRTIPSSKDGGENGVEVDGDPEEG
nr:ORF2 [Torque teno felis virus]